MALAPESRPRSLGGGRACLPRSLKDTVRCWQPVRKSLLTLRTCTVIFLTKRPHVTHSVGTQLRRRPPPQGALPNLALGNAHRQEQPSEGPGAPC